MDAYAPTKVPLKHSASFLFNNLSANGKYLTYTHKARVEIVKDDRDFLREKPAVSRASFKEDDKVMMSKYCKLTIGDVLVVVTVGGLVHVYDETGQKLLNFHKCQDEREYRSIATNGKQLLYVGRSDGVIVVYKVTMARMSVIGKLEGHKHAVTDIDFMESDQGQLLASADENGDLVLHDCRDDGDHAVLQTFVGDGAMIGSLILTRDFVVAADITGHIKLYDLQRWELHSTIAAHTRAITGLAYNEEKRLIVSCSEDTFVNGFFLPSGPDSVAKAFSFDVASALLTGVQFTGPHKAYLALTAYDFSGFWVVQA